MIRKIIILIALITLSMTGFSQAALIGEGQVDQVRLSWNLPVWKYNVVGFHVKRRIYNEKKPKKWETINPILIHPEIDGDRDLRTCSNSDSVRQAVRELFKKRVAAGDWVVTDSLAFLKELRKNGTEPFKLLIGLNYNMALISGFAYIDDQIEKPKGGKSYEYAVFTVLEDGTEIAPKKTSLWEWGTRKNPELDLEPKLTSNRAKTRIKPRWKLNMEQFRSNETLLGFNIYRLEGSIVKKLNAGLLYPNSLEKDPVVMAIDKRNVAARVPITYRITVVSAMGIEYILQEDRFDPLNVPAEFSVQIDTIYDLKLDLNQDAIIAWSFPEDQNRFIANISIYRGTSYGNMEPITDTLAPTSRAWIDKSYKTQHQKLIYKVEAVFKDDFLPIASYTKDYKFFRRYFPAKAINLTGAYVIENGKRIIRFNFDAPDHPELIGYKLLEYVDSSRWVSHQVEAAKNTLIEEVDYYICQRKTFAVQGYTKNYVAGPISDSIEVIIGGEFIQRVYPKWLYDKENHSVTLSWPYDSEKYAEVIGFRVYMDGTLLADEALVGTFQRSYQTEELDYGWHQFEVIAVSKYGTLSEAAPTQKLFIRRYY